MTPLLVSIDKSGDLKIGSRKCRLHKKSNVVKTAKAYNIPTENKTVGELCLSIKTKAMSGGNFNRLPLAHVYRNKIPLAKLYQNDIPLARLYQNKIPLAKLYPGAAKRIAGMEKTMNMNNVPLARLYPGAAKRIAAMKKVSPARVVIVDRAMTPPAASKVMVATKPKAKPTKNAAIKRIGAMKDLTTMNKLRLQRMIVNNAASPARVIRLGREIARLQ
jgi:hypothetical protein